MKIRQLFIYLISIPKTIYFNFICFPFNQAYRLPIFVAYNVKLLNVRKGIVKIESPIKCALVRIGFYGTEIISNKTSIIDFKQGEIIFKGQALFARGCAISISNGTLIFGENFFANKNFFVSCNNKISFGDDALLGWNVSIFDATGHVLTDSEGNDKRASGAISIGDHVWICAEAHLLKDSVIADNSVVAYGSLVTSKFIESNSLIGGYPAKYIRSGISWRK